MVNAFINFEATIPPLLVTSGGANRIGNTLTLCPIVKVYEQIHFLTMQETKKYLFKTHFFFHNKGLLKAVIYADLFS
ncbi:hypothetical protein DVH26_16285 [Paenibacillus sp. H1-7]|nr:hypothetical protein DVH26_16285 [Paenibacillus sp. H1-7]